MYIFSVVETPSVSISNIPIFIISVIEFIMLIICHNNITKLIGIY